MSKFYDMEYCLWLIVTASIPFTFYNIIMNMKYYLWLIVKIYNKIILYYIMHLYLYMVSEPPIFNSYLFLFLDKLINFSEPKSLIQNQLVKNPQIWWIVLEGSKP